MQTARPHNSISCALNDEEFQHQKSSLSEENASPLKRNRFASETIHVSDVASDERHCELGDPFFEGIPDDKSHLSSYHMPCTALM